jgi:hypothetical protein
MLVRHHGRVPTFHVPKPGDRPDVEVLVDETWCPGELRYLEATHRAGLPAHTSPAPTLCVTTALAPMTAPCPTVSPSGPNNGGVELGGGGHSLGHPLSGSLLSSHHRS